MPQCGHRRQEQALLYPSFASAWAQEIGTSSSVPFFRLNVNSLWVWEACFVADTHTMKVWGYEKLVLLLIPTLWKVWGYGKLVLLLIPTLWKVWGYGKLILLLIPKLWKPEDITRELYILKCSSWVSCILGLYRKNELWDTKIAANKA